jgi:hypothetical protein
LKMNPVVCLYSWYYLILSHEWSRHHSRKRSATNALSFNVWPITTLLISMTWYLEIKFIKGLSVSSCPWALQFYRIECQRLPGHLVRAAVSRGTVHPITTSTLSRPPHGDFQYDLPVLNYTSSCLEFNL